MPDYSLMCLRFFVLKKLGAGVGKFSVHNPRYGFDVSDYVLCFLLQLEQLLNGFYLDAFGQMDRSVVQHPDLLCT